jgi:hypothetical protein
MEDGMKRISDEQLNDILKGMKADAPKGFSQHLMQRIRSDKPKRSPLTWLLPISVAVVAALVILISVNINPTTNIALNGNGVMVDDIAPTRDMEIDEGRVDEEVFGMNSESVSVNSYSVRAMDIPIGGYTSPPSGSTEVSNLETRLTSNRNMTASIVSGIVDKTHLNTLMNSLRDFGSLYIRTDSYGNYLIDMGIHYERVEEFEDTINPLLDELSEDDQGSVFIRVTAVR